MIIKDKEFNDDLNKCKQVHDAGHMVPMDQPKAALEMLKGWMENSLTGVDAVTTSTTTEGEDLVAQM